MMETENKRCNDQQVDETSGICAGSNMTPAMSTYPTCSWNKSASGWTWHQVGIIKLSMAILAALHSGQNDKEWSWKYSGVMLEGLVTSTSTLASAQLHQIYQLTISDLSDPPSRKKRAGNLLTIFTAEECSCRAGLVESEVLGGILKRLALKTVPGDEPDACQSCNPLGLKLQKGKDVDIAKRIKTGINHQSSAGAQKSQNKRFFRWSVWYDFSDSKTVHFVLSILQ